MTESPRRVLRRDPDPHLFRPLALRSVTARNRIMMSPMCQYSATDGMPADWHFVHLGSRAVGGAGIVTTEVVHVSPEGRITPNCLGLWNDAQRDAFVRIAAFVAAQGAVPAIQIGHAGRKAAISRPWDGNRPLAPHEGGWPVIGPSALPFADDHQTPAAMTAADIARVHDDFAAAARRAREAGFKLVELHCAHGYLAHQFLSPIANVRTDAYGGSPENRARFMVELVAAVRREWPDDLPLVVRLSCTDWVEGGFDIDGAVDLARRLKAGGGVDLIDCSSGGLDPRQRIPVHPGYQVPFAERIRREAGIATGAVGLLHSPDAAEAVLGNGQADLIIMGRTLLADPYWPLRAAKALRRPAAWPVQYERADIF